MTNSSCFQFWDRYQYKHRLSLLQGLHHVQTLHDCVNTQNLIHLPLKLVPPIFLIFRFQWDILLVLKLLALFTYPRSNHLIGDQQSVCSLSAIDTSDLPYHTLEEISRPPTPDLFHYPLRFDNQKLNHPRQVLRYHILPVNKRNNSLQYSTVFRNGELTRLTQTTAELKSEVTVKIFGLYPHPIPASTHFKLRILLSPFVVTSLQFTSTYKPPFDLEWGNINFYNSISGLKYETTFWKIWFSSM